MSDVIHEIVAFITEDDTGETPGDIAVRRECCACLDPAVWEDVETGDALCDAHGRFLGGLVEVRRLPPAIETRAS